MEKTDVEAFKGKLIRGVLALTTRTFILQAISFASTFILTILLSPSVFGVFFIVSAVISLLSYFSDFGLAAALIQKKEEPSRAELVSAFTLQQLLVGGICLFLFILSLPIGSLYKLDADGIFLLRALLVSFFLSSLKTIPSVLLERKLQFETLVLPQILETFAFYFVAILLALAGQEVTSFAWAAIARGMIGTIALHIISPWKIGIGISFGSLKALLNFGLPFQANSFLAFVKDDLMTLFLGKILPVAHIGFLGWAKKWAEAPLRLIMDNIIRVTFPAYSRLQDDRIVLGKAVEKSFFFLGLFIFPISAMLILYIRPMIEFIPKYSKWTPAIFAFYLYTASAIFSSFSTPMVNALNAIGKIKATLLLMVFWTGLTWILVPIFSISWGFNGAATAALVISLSAVLPVVMIRKFVKFSIFSPLFKPFFSTVIIALLIYMIVRFNQTLAAVIISVVSGFIIYGLLVWFWMKEEIKPYLPKFLKLNQ